MAIYSTPVNRVAASKAYSDPDSDSSEGEGSGTRDTALQPNTIKRRIFSAPS